MLKSSIAVLAMLLMTQSASAQTPPPADLPAVLKPSSASVYLEVPAAGVQIYTCGKNASGAWAWNFKAPEAELFDTQKKPIGKHYGGPTWEGADGGKVVGAVKANAPSQAANAIPWLLLDVKSSEGAGVFTQAKEVLRITTVGGAAPSDTCGEAQSGQESRVPYTATYLLLK